MTGVRATSGALSAPFFWGKHLQADYDSNKGSSEPQFKRKITEISVQKRNSHRRAIYLDGEFAFGVDEEIVARYGLKVGSELADADLLRILQKEETLKAKEVALRSLSVRARSRKEITDRLTRKGFTSDIVSQVADDLEQAGLIDDSEFARAWVRERLRTRPKGRQMLRLELRQKGIDNQTAESAIQEAFADVDETLLAAELLKRRLGRYQGLDKEKIRRRMADFLLRRGFNRETVRQTLAEVWKREIDES